MSDSTSPDTTILYCHCAWARAVPPAVKAEVLRGLADSGRSFEAVPDLCEMSARKDPRLAELAARLNLHIAACYPRAVKWLFKGGGAELPEGVPVENMREAEAPAVLDALLNGTPTAEETPTKPAEGETDADA